MQTSAHSAPPRGARTRNWLADFTFTPGAVTVKQTGARIPIEPEIIGEVLSWFAYFVAVLAARPVGPPIATAAFAPSAPRPWYLLWPVMRLAGVRVVADAGAADLLIHFEDSTENETQPPKPLRPGQRLLNFGCRSVAKSAVAAAFEQAFGYSLAINPASYEGQAVEKSEANGVHDGRIVSCPTVARPGYVYQRLVENAGPDGLMEDLRTPTIGGRASVVFLKRRGRKERFTNHNVSCGLSDAQAVFSAEEQAKLAAFCAALGLDWGGLDVLRDARDGRLYVVDANKTDMGPPIALPLRDKLAATRTLAHALRDFISRPAGACSKLDD